MTRTNNGIFLSQTGAGWMIQKGLRTGIGFGRANNRSLFIPPEFRPMQMLAPSIPGRNQPCPCGSGKKFKKCCGAT